MPLSVKTKEHFRRRMALAGPKWGALMGGAVALTGVIMFTTSALHFVTVTDTHGGSTRILTVNQTEAAVLAQAGVAPLGENDRIVTSETPDGELMQVLRAYTVPVTADGQTQEIITTGATTRDLLTQAGLTYTEEDYLTPAADETVPEGSSVTLQRVSYVVQVLQVCKFAFRFSVFSCFPSAVFVWGPSFFRPYTRVRIL